MATYFNVRMPSTNYSSGQTLEDQASDQFRTLEQNFANFVQALQDEITPQAMHDALEDTLYLSQVYVPKKTLNLMGSAYLEIKSRGSNGQFQTPQVELGYTADYAIFVHEMTQYHHEPPTCAKFLERAMNEDAAAIPSRIATSIIAQLGM